MEGCSTGKTLSGAAQAVPEWRGQGLEAIRVPEHAGRSVAVPLGQRQASLSAVAEKEAPGVKAGECDAVVGKTDQAFRRPELCWYGRARRLAC